VPCGRKEQRLLAGADPQRTTDPAREEQLIALLVQPGRGHRAVELLERPSRPAARTLDEREDHLGVDGHLRLVPLDVVEDDQLLVVDDDPVVDPDDGAVADRVVVGVDPGVALRVVANVDERLGRLRRQRDLVEQLTGAAALLADGHHPAGAAVGVPDRVRASLGDPRQESLGHQRPVEAASWTEAESGDTTHS
jgi:hypothetical protein